MVTPVGSPAIFQPPDILGVYQQECFFELVSLDPVINGWAALKVSNLKLHIFSLYGLYEYSAKRMVGASTILSQGF